MFFHRVWLPGVDLLFHQLRRAIPPQPVLRNFPPLSPSRARLHGFKRSRRDRKRMYNPRQRRCALE